MTEPGPFALADRFPEQTFDKVVQSEPEPAGRRFEDCSFLECRFSGPALRAASFINCSFQGCDLSNWDVTGLRFVGAQFKGSKLVGIDWTKTNRDPLTAFNFEEWLLDYGDFSRLKLVKFQLIRCSVKGVNFERTNMAGADCRGSDFGDSVFVETDLSKADFREARGYSFDPRTNKIRAARFSAPEALNLLTAMELKIE